MIGATKNMGIACDCKVPVPPREEKWQMLAIEDQAIGEFFGERLITCLALKLAGFEFGFSCDANGFSSGHHIVVYFC